MQTLLRLLTHSIQEWVRSFNTTPYTKQRHVHARTAVLLVLLHTSYT